MTLDKICAAYEARVAAVPQAARRFAEDAWGKAWAHAEMGSLLDFAALASAPPAPSTGEGGRDFETRLRAAFDAAHLMPALPLADDPIDAVMALAAAARQSAPDDKGNAFVLQHILRVVNSFAAARSPVPGDAGDLATEVQRLRDVLTYISCGTTLVYEDDEGCDVEVNLDAEDLREAAYKALLPRGGAR